MSWNQDEARDRLRAAYKETKGLTLSKLMKERDLHELPLNECKTVSGMQAYIEIVNFGSMLEDARADRAKLIKLLRDLHVLQRLVRKLLLEREGAVRVHFQGSRLHAVFHKPYDTEENAARSRLEVAKEFASQVRELAQLVSDEVDRPFEVESGLECGDTIAAKNGQKNARELMFVGDAANQAAKILEGKAGDRLGPEAAKIICKATPAPLPEKWKSIVEDEVADYPVKDFDTFCPKEASIDFESLGRRIADLDPGASFFADIRGFTTYIASLKSEAEKIEALRILHAVRSEMHEIVERAYDGDFIQYQGDRIQSIHYQAKGKRTWTTKLIECAAAMRRAFEIIREEFPSFDRHVTMGAAAGRTFVTRVGTKGDKDEIALGSPVARASSLQGEVATDDALAIDTKLWELLDSDLQEDFKKVGDHYEATLDLKKVVAKADRAMFDSPVKIVGANQGSRTVRPDPAGVLPAKSYLNTR